MSLITSHRASRLWQNRMSWWLSRWRCLSRSWLSIKRLRWNWLRGLISAKGLSRSIENRLPYSKIRLISLLNLRWILRLNVVILPHSSKSASVSTSRNKMMLKDNFKPFRLIMKPSFRKLMGKKRLIYSWPSFSPGLSTNLWLPNPNYWRTLPNKSTSILTLIW